ncbi:MAG: DUF5674 family protein [bacterium]
MNIEIIKTKISKQKLHKIAKNNYGNMVKGVIDIHLKIIALGGELHADAEAILLQKGSNQQDLWGFNIYIDKPISKRIQYTSFINIRPAQNNRSLEIKNAELKAKIKRIIDSLIRS